MTWDWDELLEAWCEDFSPDSFGQQTARTFIAAMRGRASARRRQAERDLILAYNTGAFSRASKVKPLSHYLRELRGDDGSMAALSYFRALKSKGVNVTITRVPRASKSPAAGAN